MDTGVQPEQPVVVYVVVADGFEVHNPKDACTYTVYGVQFVSDETRDVTGVYEVRELLLTVASKLLEEL